jgi:hypothetical protein
MRTSHMLSVSKTGNLTTGRLVSRRGMNANASESAAFARRRSGVRISSAPPKIAVLQAKCRLRASALDGCQTFMQQRGGGSRAPHRLLGAPDDVVLIRSLGVLAEIPVVWLGAPSCRSYDRLRRAPKIASAVPAATPRLTTGCISSQL